MVKIKQYNKTLKYFYFMVIITPVVALLSYFPNFNERWTIIGYSFRVGISYLMILLLIIILSNKMIIFSESTIVIKKYKKEIKKYLWSNIKKVDVNYNAIIKRYQIEFDDGFKFLFEASNKLILKINEACPIKDITKRFSSFI